MSDERNPVDQAVEQLLDLFVYAPIGLLYERDEVLPKLVNRGRNQVQLARVLSQLAVQRSQGQVEQRLDEALTSPADALARFVTDLGALFGLAPPPPADDPSTSATAPGTTPATGPAAAGADAVLDEPGAALDAPGPEPSPPDVDAPGREPSAPDVDGSAPASDGPDGGEGPATPANPIAGYDQLRVRDILPLLIDLTPAQRRAVRHDEVAGRGRKTILNQIDRLGA